MHMRMYHVREDDGKEDEEEEGKATRRINHKSK